MARIRNLLIDNTLGKVFTNVARVTDVDASKLIAGIKLQSKTIKPGNVTTAVRVTKNLGGTGIYFPTASLVTDATVIFAKAPSNAGTSVVFKAGATYDTATTVGTISIASQAVNTAVTLNATIAAGQYLFVDIATAAATGSGFGISIIANYYGN